MSNDFAIRDLRLPDDRPACISFIDGLQKYEHAFEPNRRVDAIVAEEYFTLLLKRVAENEGRIFIAEMAGVPVGWAVFVLDDDSLYVVEEERRCAYLAELFVQERARGTGLGKALIAACENQARAKGVKVFMIGVLPKNTGARGVYLAAGFEPYSEQLRKYL
jgi:GNAT superfamily N-acetyltransferase